MKKLLIGLLALLLALPVGAGLAEAAEGEAATYGQVAQMLNEVHRAHYGKDSQFLTQVQELDPEDVNKPATRFFFAQALYCSAMENVFDFDYENYFVWAENCTVTDPGFAWPDSQVIGLLLDGTAGEGGVWGLCPDCAEIEAPPEDPRYQNYLLDYGSSPAVNYAMLTYDRRDGRKVLELDENYYFHPFRTMTLAEAEAAVDRYDHSFEEAPEMVPYADTKPYDASILTDALLNHESGLPDASSASLPAEWHGALMMDMARVVSQALGATPDKQIYEYEIQTAKDIGFNFLGIGFDFSTLQGPVPEAGTLNETRLKQLDQVIAWCVERDIHVDLRCVSPGGLTLETPFDEWVAWNHDALQTTDYAPEFAALWGALARRYDGIPNRYLSFNLLIEAELNSDDQYVAFFSPAVEAIRAASPDRCVIADVHCGGLKAEKIADMGVALSYHAYDPREFCAQEPPNQDDEAFLSAAAWPFTASDGITYDAQAVLDSPIYDSVSANGLAEIAERHGVGFMVGEWGMFTNGLTRHRYSDEVIAAFIDDMGRAMKEKGYGWCYGGINGVYSPTCHTTAIIGAEYEQVGDYPLYVDQLMAALFKGICE